MSQFDSIKMFLNFQDNNINIIDSYIETFNDVRTKVIYAELTFEPECCPHCGTTNKKIVVKYGWKTINIKILPIIEHNAYLRLKKQRFKYKSCGSTFLAQTSIEGSISFIYCNGETGKLIDIVEDRRLSNLKRYFNLFPLKTRKMVKHIVIDMYAPYITLIRELFPCAKISIDRFHIVQLINRAFNKTRIFIMKKYKYKDPPLYTKLKKYWKLLLKSALKLKNVAEYNKFFKKYISQNNIINYLTSQDIELEQAYEIYQDFLFAIRKKHYKYFLISLEKYSSMDIISQYMKISIKTYKKYLKHISNSINYSFNNGYIEGLNNKIKVLKRISFGYRNYDNFRRRILMIKSLVIVKNRMAA